METKDLQLSDEDVTRVEKIRGVYAKERDKRVRDDKASQFLKVDGDFRQFSRDINHPEKSPRPAVSENVEVLIVGGGHCGLLAATELVKSGIADFRILDSAADFGGAWYWNRYPGLRCDIDSYIYLPLLEETGVVPKSKYASGPEIFNNAQLIGKKYDLYSKALFQTQVTESRWSDDENCWQVSTDRGDTIQAKFVVMALGPLNKPKLPGIPGIDKYTGKLFHTSRWDYEYTGGSGSDEEPVMDKLRDKRVALIGTGCTGIQCAPRLAAYAQHLSVVQRTPAAVNPRNNTPTDEEWFASQEAGWQAERATNFDEFMQGIVTDTDLVHDGWTEISDVFRAAWTGDGAGTESGQLRAELVDLDRMDGIRHSVDELVADPDTAAKLKAWYRLFCKRPTFSDHYLQMFNQDNVELLDTNGKGVDAFTETGLVINGEEHHFDCVIFASGYEVGTDYCRRGNIRIHGREGLSLSDYWADHMKTLYGYMSYGFPNCFHMGVFLQNAAFGNFTSVYMRQAEKIRQFISAVRDSGAEVIEPTKAAEDAWVEVIRTGFQMTRDFYVQCTPGYYNGEGDPDSGAGLGYDQFAGGVNQFNDLVEQWFQGGMPGVEIR